MCRSIKPLNNLAPPATDEEVYEAARQYVRKIGGSLTPSQANQAAYDEAIATITAATRTLVDSLHTTAAPRDREALAAARRAANAKRFGTP